MPGIYTKLIDIDKVDLLIGPYATNMVAAAIPVLATTRAHDHRHHRQRGQQPVPLPPLFLDELDRAEPEAELFERASSTSPWRKTPKPQTIAILGADAEFGRNATDGTREMRVQARPQVVYDRNYPPHRRPTSRRSCARSRRPIPTFSMSHPIRPIRWASCARPTRSASTPRCSAACSSASTITSVQMQLGPLINGIVNYTTFLLPPAARSARVDSLIEKYQARAPALGVDPLGYTFPPLAMPRARFSPRR